MTSPLLALHGVRKRFPGVQALDGAALEVLPGEVHVLLGENGAGKSTLMKILCGLHAADEGEIRFGDTTCLPGRRLDARRLGIAMVHQEFNLVPGMSVAENLFLGEEPTTAGFIRKEEMRRGARALLDQLGAAADPDQPVGRLSVAGQQLVEIARALREQAKLLILDEPTAALAEHECEALFNRMRALGREGVGLIFISHRMKDIYAVGDRITVMRDGRTVATRSLREIEPAELIRLMVGRDLKEQIAKREVACAEETLVVEGLERLRSRRPISFTVRAGEIFGVAGLMGSGRTGLARALFGAEPRRGGTVRVCGRAVPPADPAASCAARLGFITEDRKRLGLFLGRSVRENITLTILDELTHVGLLDLGAERTRVGKFVEQLKIRLSSTEQAIVNLSGGNQQKALLARWLAARCRVLILDEPTRGIDVGAKAEIYALIGELVAQGVAIILISSEMPEILGLADRVAVMCDGELAGIIPRAEATQEKIMQLAVA